jgi:hypothetical protein
LGEGSRSADQNHRGLNPTAQSRTPLRGLGAGPSMAGRRRCDVGRAVRGSAEGVLGRGPRKGSSEGPSEGPSEAVPGRGARKRLRSPIVEPHRTVRQGDGAERQESTEPRSPRLKPRAKRTKPFGLGQPPQGALFPEPGASAPGGSCCRVALLLAPPPSCGRIAHRRPHRLAWSRTRAFQARDRGSNPLGGTL